MSNGQGLIQRPKKGFPHTGFKDLMWIKIEALRLQSQSTGGRGGSIKIDRRGATFKFIAPEEIQETIQHEWEAYESMQSRLMEKYKAAIKIGEDIRGLKKIGGKKVLEGLASEGDIGNKISSAIGNIDLSTNIPKVKVDTPLVYTESTRREWNLDFRLASYTINTYDEVVMPVKELMKYSSPSFGGSQINIEFPWIFRLSTEPGNLILAKHAALIAVQPTWKAPYRNGSPSSCDLTLTFKDLSPLFKETIEKGGIINVIGG